MSSTESNAISGDSKFSSLNMSLRTKDGLKPARDRATAIKEYTALEDKEAPCSLIGMAGYLDSFIENYTATAAPLYQLARKDLNFIGKKKIRNSEFKAAYEMKRLWH